MNIYEISQPGKQIVDVQGVAIRTETVTITTPPAVPTTFTLWGLTAGNTQYGIVSQSFSFAVPEITQVFWADNPLRYQIGMRVLLFNQSGQLAWVNASGSAIAVDWYLTPGDTVVTRCDIIVTVQDSPLQELRLQGNNSQPCGTWTTRSIDDCRDTEIKCNDPSDPRGFCCIPCDTLNTKLRGLIV